MADQMIFKRCEIKYMLDITQAELLKNQMKQYMTADEHGVSTICSLYFDTPDYLLIQRSMEHPVYKEKLRLRSYGMADKDTTVFVELKEFRMSAIPLVIIIAREFMVSGLRLLAAEEGVVIAAGIWGKLKTAFTMVTIVGVVAYLSLAYDFGLAVPDFVRTWILGGLIWISTILTIISGLVYLKGCWKYIDGDK
mgnify:CR=1 FL=1